MNKVHINMTRTELRRTVTACSARDVAMVLFIFSVWGDSWVCTPAIYGA